MTDNAEYDALRQAAERMHDDAEACGDPAGSFIPAVADWLDKAADHIDAHDDANGLLPHGSVCPTALEGLECSMLQQAVAVARAYVIPPGECNCDGDDGETGHDLLCPRLATRVAPPGVDPS